MEIEDTVTDSRSEAVINNLAVLQEYIKEARDLLLITNSLTEEWYINRYKYITTFAEINWRQMATYYSNKDATMYNLANMIDNNFNIIIDYYSNNPGFPFMPYYRLLNNINEIWNYYEQNYRDPENDVDITELTEHMLFMSKI
jgi:hypothetical protein